MKSLAARSYEQMWNKIEADIVTIASDRYAADLPELGLLSAIVVQAGRDQDSDYFKTESFQDHARLLKISPVFIAILVKRAWNLQQSGQVWEQTPPLLENDDD